LTLKWTLTQVPAISKMRDLRACGPGARLQRRDAVDLKPQSEGANFFVIPQLDATTTQRRNDAAATLVIRQLDASSLRLTFLDLVRQRL
jgi:hypothetical protein